jgi:cytochrome c peroxidase
MGRFRAPTLRNIAITAPYMHDGSLATLDDVLDHYLAGGTVTEEGLNAGDGRRNPYKSVFVRPFELDDTERADLLAFLEALTDRSVLTNPAFSNPYRDTD